MMNQSIPRDSSIISTCWSITKPIKPQSRKNTTCSGISWKPGSGASRNPVHIIVIVIQSWRGGMIKIVAWIHHPRKIICVTAAHADRHVVASAICQLRSHRGIERNKYNLTSRVGFQKHLIHLWLGLEFFLRNHQRRVASSCFPVNEMKFIRKTRHFHQVKAKREDLFPENTACFGEVLLKPSTKVANVQPFLWTKEEGELQMLQDYNTRPATEW